MAGKGKQFERAIKESVDESMIIYRFKDAPKNFQAEQTRFTPSNICDFLICNPWNKNIYWIEAKETKGASLPFTNINFQHLEKMIDMDRSGFSESWLLIRFADKSQTIGVRARKIDDFRKTQMMLEKPRKSLSYQWCIENGNLAEEKIIRTKYRLNLKSIIGDDNF